MDDDRAFRRAVGAGQRRVEDEVTASQAGVEDLHGQDVFPGHQRGDGGGQGVRCRDDGFGGVGSGQRSEQRFAGRWIQRRHLLSVDPSHESVVANRLQFQGFEDGGGGDLECPAEVDRRIGVLHVREFGAGPGEEGGLAVTEGRRSLRPTGVEEAGSPPGGAVARRGLRGAFEKSPGRVRLDQRNDLRGSGSDDPQAEERRQDGDEGGETTPGGVITHGPGLLSPRPPRPSKGTTAAGGRFPVSVPARGSASQAGEQVPGDLLQP
jgi:hypothetical protein